MLRCTDHNLRVNVNSNGVIHVSRFASDPNHLTSCNTETTTSGGRIFASAMVTRNGRTFREWSVID